MNYTYDWTNASVVGLFGVVYRARIEGKQLEQVFLGILFYLMLHYSPKQVPLKDINLFMGVPSEKCAEVKTKYVILS